MSPYRLRVLWALLAAFAVIAGLSSACGDSDETGTNGRSRGEPFPVTVTDSEDRELTFRSAPTRMVVLSPAHVEILFAIDAGVDVVGVDDFTNFPPEAERITKLSGFQPNLEAIAALRPDLVILFFDPGDLQVALERLGIPVLILGAPKTIDGVLEQITLLGKVTARNDEAASLRTDLEERIEAVTNRLKNETQGPRLFHELDPTLFTTCPGEFIHDMYVKLKARNIATSAGLPCQLSQEALIAADPQVIILADEPAGVTPQSVKERSGWANITAIKNGAIYTVDADIFSRPGPRIVDAFEQLAKLLYPDTFR